MARENDPLATDPGGFARIRELIALGASEMTARRLVLLGAGLGEDDDRVIESVTLLAPPNLPEADGAAPGMTGA